jgi:NTP pyrophosphatase (non-canonical NTP hydrolase)
MAGEPAVGQTALAELVGEAREEAEGRAGDFAYRQSGGWESVAGDAGFWYEWHWDEVKEELADRAEELNLAWESVETPVRAAFEETFRESFV